MAERFALLAEEALPRAELIRALLEDHGIPAHIDSENAHAVSPLEFGGLIFARVVVPEEVLGEARELLRQLPKPDCTKVDLSPEAEARRIGFAAYFGFIFPPYFLISLLQAIQWLKYNSGKPGQAFVKMSLIVTAIGILFWILLPFGFFIKSGFK